MKRITLILSALSLCGILNAQELKRSVTWENICNNPAPLPVIGQVEPVRSSLDRPSYWSVGCETLDRNYGNFENFKQFIGETGVGYARLQSGWARCEKKKGKYDFAWLDRQVDELLAQGVHPWICLCYGNPIYSNHGHDLDAKLFPDGPIMDAWLKYVRAVVTRYKGKVTMFEVWNEPDGNANLDSYNLYANLFTRTGKLIREIDPDVKIAAFGSCAPDRKYIRQALAEIKRLGGIDCIDYITYHAYWPNPDYVTPAALELKRDVAAYSDRIALLQGETGCPAQLEYGHALREREWNEYSQVKWDLRQMMSQFSIGVPSSVFTMVDLNYGWMIQSFGLVRTNLKCEPVYKRPKFYGVQNVTSVITTEFTPDTTLRVESACGRRIRAVGLKKNDVVVGYALWFSDSIPEGNLDRTPVDLNVYGATLKNPVYVDLVSGNVHSLEPLIYQMVLSDGICRWSRLPLWDAPVLVIEKDCINIQK